VKYETEDRALFYKNKGMLDLDTAVVHLRENGNSMISSKH
jgi:hypothetical protein